MTMTSVSLADQCVKMNTAATGLQLLEHGHLGMRQSRRREKREGKKTYIQIHVQIIERVVENLAPPPTHPSTPDLQISYKHLSKYACGGRQF